MPENQSLSASPFRFARRAEHLKPSAIREMLKATESPDVISFAGGLPAPELFPVADIAEACTAVLAEEGRSALQYSSTEGYLPLRQWICEELAQTVGLRCTPEQVLMTSGSQQGLDLAARVLIDPGDVVLVENPAYLGALQAFGAYEPRLVGIESDRDGIRPEALSRALSTLPSRPKFLYLIPNFHNPTGATLPIERRRQLAEIAAARNIPILEDDPYGRLRYQGNSLPAIAGMDLASCVYLGTFSKILAPGLRVGWMVVQERALWDKLIPAKQAVDLHTSGFTQRVVWRYVARPGVLDAHVRELIRAYRGRRDAMLAALAWHMPAGCSWNTPDGGLFLWLTLPENIDTTELLCAAAGRRVAFVPGAPFWVGGEVRNALRLNFSNAAEDKIVEGISRLGELVKERLTRPAGSGVGAETSR